MEPTHFESLYLTTTRENEIARILAFIKEGNSCQVISLPGGGRSNLLGLLAYNRNVRFKHLGENQKWFHFVLSNFAEVRKRSLLDNTKFLFLNLIASLRERGMKEEHQKTSAIFKKSLEFNDELVLFQGLKRTIDLLSIEKELTVVFLFDRFEDYIPTVTPEFFTNLRVLRDRAKYRFSVVFSTHKPLEDLIGQDLLSDFYQFVAGHTIYLPLLDKPGLDFRIAYMEKVSGKTLGKEIIDAIISQTSGHANLTRLCIETALETSLRHSGDQAKLETPESLRALNTRGDSGQARMTPFLLEQKPIRAALYDIWKSLTPAEQTLLTSSHPSFRHSGNQAKPEHPESEILKQVQNDKRDAGQARLADSPRFAGEAGATAKRASMTGFESISYLENVGLIKNNKITIPLFEQFIKKEVVQTLSQTKQKIAFDPNTNEITKGNLMLSDTLTSSEFKLLSLLLQNPQKIIERDEIISVVWANTKSTAGVTDQALDQLIFRLRKKIEDDPNKPAHLQTVKGRGIRFVQ